MSKEEGQEQYQEEVVGRRRRRETYKYQKFSQTGSFPNQTLMGEDVSVSSLWQSPLPTSDNLKRHIENVHVKMKPEVGIAVHH